MDKPFIFLNDFERKLLEDYPKNGLDIINRIKDIVKLYNADYEYLLLEMNNVIYDKN